MCVCTHLPTSTSNSQTAAECLRIQFNSDIIYPEIEADSTGKGLGPTRPPSLQTPIQAQVVSCASDWLAINQRLPWLLPWVRLLWENSSQNSGNPVYSLHYWFTDINGYESIDKWRATQGKVPNERDSVLMELRTHHGGTWIHSSSPTWKLSEKGPMSVFSGILWRLHYTVMTD